MLRCSFFGVMVLVAIQFNTPKAGAWGAAHRRMARGAVEHLPPSMKPFFEANLVAVANAVGVEPPRPPDHRIKMDRFPGWPNTPITRDRDEIDAFFGEQFLLDIGEVPWAAAEWTQILSDQMRAATTYQHWTQLIPTAGRAGHYVTDIHQPFHLTKNGDGRDTGNDGIHFRYESTLVNLFEDQLPFTPGSVQYQSSMIDTVFDAIEGTSGVGTGIYQYIDPILAADDIASAIDPHYGTNYYNAMWPNTSSFTKTLFQDASQMLANTWYTAWVDAGSPVIPDPSTQPPVPFNTIGHWRLEEGPLGGDATTVVSSVNSPALNGIEASGRIETYSADVPGTMIFDPTSETTVANDFSLFSDSKHPGYRFDVDGSLTEPTSFTFEIFIKSAAGPDGFQAIAAKERVGNLEFSWALMANGSGNLLLHADTELSSGGPGSNQAVYTNSPVQDGEWHHVAVTYDETNTIFELFYDYESVGVLDPEDGGNEAILYDQDPLTIGGRLTGDSWFGWIDEARLTDAAIIPGQFLTAIVPMVESGDFDNDGDVDGNDFLIWQASFYVDDGGDADGDGDTDGNDYLIWQSQFGGAGAAVNAEAVPEPTSLSLAAMIALVCAGTMVVFRRVA